METSCHVLIRASEVQRNPLIGVLHVEDFEEIEEGTGDDPLTLIPGTDNFNPFICGGC